MTDFNAYVGGVRYGQRSHYSYTVEQGVVCIVDANDGGLSVTNDAENVIADMVAGGLLTTQPVIYCDSEGRWDVLLVEGGRFAGFAPIGATSREHAIAVVLAGLEEALADPAAFVDSFEEVTKP